jgi:hypothetical protein
MGSYQVEMYEAVVGSCDTLKGLIKKCNIGFYRKNGEERLLSYDVDGLFQNNVNFRYTFKGYLGARNGPITIYYVKSE